VAKSSPSIPKNRGKLGGNQVRVQRVNKNSNTVFAVIPQSFARKMEIAHGSVVEWDIAESKLFETVLQLKKVDEDLGSAV